MYMLNLFFFFTRKTFKFAKNYELDGVGPVDNRPSTAEAPPIGKIHKIVYFMTESAISNH